MRQSPLVFGVDVLAFGILSVVPGLRATGVSEADTNSSVIGEPAAPGEGTVLSLSPSRNTGAVSAKCASKLAVNTMPTLHATVPIGVCASTSRCSTRQRGLLHPSREPDW